MKGCTRWIIAYDSHGKEIDSGARKAFLEFQKHWKPQLTIHGGDWLDLAALRAGASDDEANEGIRADVEAGIAFIKEIGASVLCAGNHDFRLVRELTRRHGRLREYATLVYNGIMDRLGDGIQHIPYGKRGFYQLGNFKVIHGVHHGLYAARQAAQIYGNVIQGHVHCNSVFDMPSIEPCTGYTVGCLSRLDLEYANHQPNTLRWQHGFAYGLITPRKETVIWLARKTADGQWILPSEIRMI